MRADDTVALARGRLEPLSMGDFDSPVAAPDQPVTVQRPQDNGDGGTLHAEHDREEFLLEGEGIRMTGRDGRHPHVLENAVVLGAWHCAATARIFRRLNPRLLLRSHC